MVARICTTSAQLHRVWYEGGEEGIENITAEELEAEFDRLQLRSSEPQDTAQQQARPLLRRNHHPTAKLCEIDAMRKGLHGNPRGKNRRFTIGLNDLGHGSGGVCRSAVYREKMADFFSSFPILPPSTDPADPVGTAVCLAGPSPSNCGRVSGMIDIGGDLSSALCTTDVPEVNTAGRRIEIDQAHPSLASNPIVQLIIPSPRGGNGERQMDPSGEVPGERRRPECVGRLVGTLRPVALNPSPLN